MSVPKLRFRDDDGKEFPEWKKRNISEILKIGSGKDYKKLESGNIPVYGTGGYMLSVNDYLYDGESVCIGRKGTIDRPVLLSGKFWTVDTLFYTHSFVSSLPKFIYALFQNIDWKNYNEASGVPSLSKSTIEKIEVFIPSLPEQTKIANFLTAVDEKITLLTQKADLLSQYKKGVMQQIFKQELRFKDDDGQEFPEWEEKRLGDISVLITKGTTPKRFSYEGINFIKIECFDGNLILKEKCAFIEDVTHQTELKRSILFDGDILFAIAGSIGKCNIVTADILPANTNQALAIVRLKDNENRKYIYHLLSSYKMQKYIGDNISVGAQPNLNLEQMGNFNINYPSLPEQTKIANFLSAIDEKITTNQTQLNALKQYKQGLLQQMFV